MSAINHRFVETNGIRMHVAEAGDAGAPLVVLCHGFPELWWSWRHQLDALAAAGYRAVAPDQRGFGQTDAPAPVEAYDIRHLTDDMVGLLDALGEQSAVFVGHDWGAPVVWNMSLLHPERVRAVVGMSVAFSGRSPDHSPIEVMRVLFEGRFFYMVYFQDQGPADRELSSDARSTLRRFYGSLPATDIASDGAGVFDWLSDPGGLPSWLSADEFEVYAAEFERTGFTGGLNWYRNLHRNWEITPELTGRTVEQPALFIAGALDPVLVMVPPQGMTEVVPDLRGQVILPEAGHWIQQEKPREVNDALLGFLGAL